MVYQTTNFIPDYKKKQIKKNTRAKKLPKKKTPMQMPTRTAKQSKGREAQKQVTNNQLPKPRLIMDRLSNVVKLSNCARNYFHALYDPYTVAGEVCIPSGTPTGSQKYKVTTHGTFQVNASGAGGVGFWPYRMVTSDIYADATPVTFPAIVTSYAAYVGTDYPFVNSPFLPAGTLFPSKGGASSPYTVANMTVSGTQIGRTAKLVAAGIRISYNGAEVNRQGQVTVWRNPTLSTFVDATADSLDNFLAQNQASRVRVTDKGTHGFTYLPLDVDDLEYPQTFPPYSGSSPQTNVGAHMRLAGGIFVTDAGNSASFAYEAVAYFEVKGGNIPTSPTPSDPTGVSIAIGASMELPMNQDTAMSLQLAIANARKLAAQNGQQLVLGN